jgi:hypothetical protein
MASANRLRLAHERKRFMRPDAWRYMRADAARWSPPVPPRPPVDVETPIYAAALKAEQAELMALKALLADLRCHVALWRFARKYNPDQPRVAAGSPEGGQWVGASEAANTPGLTQLALVIRVCVLSGVARIVDAFGNRSYSATYECAGGRLFTRQGLGHNVPGLVKDPLQ